MWLELLRTRPALAADLLGCVRPSLVPSFTEAQLESGDLSEHAPTSYHADALVTLGKPEPLLGVIIEVQLRPDRRKLLSWPVYLATARRRLCCPTVLLVISPDPDVARWARKPIELGHPGFVLRPLVLGPAEVPVIPHGDAGAVTPELVVVSAVVHGPGPEGAKVFAALLDALATIEPDQANGYIDEVLAVLPEAARDLLEAMMTTGTREYRSDFARRYVAQGKAEGKAEGRAEEAKKNIFAVLAARRIAVPDEARARIAECADLDQLEAWVPRAAVIAAIEQLFD
jgi:hypothetical protein